MGSYLQSIRYETQAGILWGIFFIVGAVFYLPFLVIALIGGGLLSILAIIHIRKDYTGSTTLGGAIVLVLLLMPLSVVYGAFHSWMLRQGFGSTFRVIVLSALSIVCAIAIPMNFQHIVLIGTTGIVSSFCAVYGKGLLYCMPSVIVIIIWLVL